MGSSPTGPTEAVRRLAVHGTLTHMESDSTRVGRPAPISTAGITSVTLAVIAVLVVAFTIPVLKFPGVLLAVAAIIVGVLGAINARRQALAGAWLGWAGTALGAAAVVWFLIWWGTADM